MTHSVRRRLLAGESDQSSQLFVPLTVAVWPEGEQWVAQCLEFDIASQGDSADQAVGEVMDAVCSYVNTLEELGEREEVFAEHSIPIYETTPASLPLHQLPREVAERANLQVRSLRIPLPVRQQALAV